MRINNMNIVSGILCVLSFLLAVSITFTDMFWYLPGFFVMLLSVVSSVVGLMSSSKVFNGITLFLKIIFFLIFSSPLLLA